MEFQIRDNDGTGLDVLADDGALTVIVEFEQLALVKPFLCLNSASIITFQNSNCKRMSNESTTQRFSKRLANCLSRTPLLNLQKVIALFRLSATFKERRPRITRKSLTIKEYPNKVSSSSQNK